MAKKITRYPCTYPLPSGLWRYRKWLNRGAPGGFEITGGPHESSRAAWEALQGALKIYRDRGRAGLRAAKPVPTVAELADRWITRVVPQTCALSTQEDYAAILRNHVLPAFGEAQADTVTRGQIKQWLLDKLAGGISISKANHLRVVLSGVLTLAVDDDLLAVNPALALGRLGSKAREREAALAPRPFAAHELGALLEALNAGKTRDYVLALTLARTGARIGEALALEWSCVNLEARVIRIERGWHRGRAVGTKTGHARPVNLSAQLVDALREHRREGARVGGLVFATSAGTPIDLANWRRHAWSPAIEAAVLPHHRIHDLRHTYASQMLAAGASPAYVAAQIGDSLQTLLRVYAHYLPGTERGRVDALDHAWVRPR